MLLWLSPVLLDIFGAAEHYSRDEVREPVHQTWEQDFVVVEPVSQA